MRHAAAAGLLVAVLATAACGSAPEQEDRMVPSQNVVATDQATVTEALRFGGIVPPPSAKVLGVQYDHGIDQRYRVVADVPPGDVASLLSASGFTAPLEPDPGPYNASVDGFDLSKATSVVSGEDSLPPSGDRRNAVVRQISVDRSDPGRSVVHLWLFTT